MYSNLSQHRIVNALLFYKQFPSTEHGCDVSHPPVLVLLQSPVKHEIAPTYVGRAKQAAEDTIAR